MTRWLVRSLVLWLALGPAVVLAALLEPGERGSFRFQDPGHFASRPITVHYFRPEAAGADAPILIALHGTERNAAGARNAWVDAAQAHRFVVLAPEFDRPRFPAAEYQQGGLRDRDPAHWTFGLVERLFDHVRAADGLTTPTYLLFGHSAGGQFVHRFALVMPQPRFSVAVSANAGSYMAPAYPGVLDLRYPAALDEALVAPAALEAAFARRLVVLLGEDDTRSDSADFPNSAEARLFGANRLERGRNFFARARAEAQRLGTPFAWELHTVPGVGHSARRMAPAAARLLFPEAR